MTDNYDLDDLSAKYEEFTDWLNSLKSGLMQDRREDIIRIQIALELIEDEIEARREAARTEEEGPEELIQGVVCEECGTVQTCKVERSGTFDYSYLNDDKHIKEAPCVKCGSFTLAMYNGELNIQIMGNARGYQSMENYWAKNPDVARKHEDEIMKKREQRAEWAKERVDNTGKGGRSHKRYDGYNKGEGEQRRSF